MFVVKASQLPGAGKGLFTKKEIKKDTLIIEYLGELITWKEYEKRVEDDQDGYLFFINKKKCIDAFNTPEALARYANDAAGIVKVKGLKNNSVYKIVKGKAYIAATKNIAAGEEIFVDYSRDYWKAVRHNIRLKQKQNAAELKRKSIKKV